MFGFDDILMGLSAGADLIGLGQSGYNLYKDINNIDIERQVDASKELMEIQNAYQRQILEYSINHSLDRQQQFSREMYGLQQRDYVNNMRLQHELNQESMHKQFNYNAILSNAARSLIQQRMAGVNPSGSTSGGSVSALGSSGGAPSPLSASPVSSAVGPSPGTLVGSRYNPVSVDAASRTLLNIRASEKTQNEAESVRIRNITQLSRDLMELQNIRSQYIKNMSESRNFDVNTDKTLKTMDATVDYINEQINELKSRQSYQSKLGDAASQNAATAVKTQEEQVRHNKMMERVAQVQNSIAQQGVNIEASKLESIIAKMSAETDLLDDAHRKNLAEEPNWVRAQLAKIGLDEALMEKAQNEAELRGLDVETYYLRLGKDILKTIMDNMFVDEEVKLEQENHNENGSAKRTENFKRRRAPKMPKIIRRL